MRATEPQTAEELADLQADQAMTKERFAFWQNLRLPSIPAPWAPCAKIPGSGGRISLPGTRMITTKTRRPTGPMGKAEAFSGERGLGLVRKAGPRT
jgi:hypothetical protein